MYSLDSHPFLYERIKRKTHIIALFIELWYYGICYPSIFFNSKKGYVVLFHTMFACCLTIPRACIIILVVVVILWFFVSKSVFWMTSNRRIEGNENTITTDRVCVLLRIVQRWFLHVELRGRLKTIRIFIFHSSSYFDLRKVGTALYRDDLWQSVQKNVLSVYQIVPVRIMYRYHTIKELVLVQVDDYY